MLFDPGRIRQAEWTKSELPDTAPACVHDEGSKRLVLSGLNHTTFDLTVYASQDGSPHHHARLASGCWSSFARRDSYPQGFSERFQSSSLFLLPKAYLTQGHHTTSAVSYHRLCFRLCFCHGESPRYRVFQLGQVPGPKCSRSVAVFRHQPCVIRGQRSSRVSCRRMSFIRHKGKRGVEGRGFDPKIGLSVSAVGVILDIVINEIATLWQLAK